MVNLTLWKKSHLTKPGSDTAHAWRKGKLAIARMLYILMVDARMHYPIKVPLLFLRLRLLILSWIFQLQYNLKV